jgi:hypothetical protein
MRTYKLWSASRWRRLLRRRFPGRGGYSRRRPQFSRSLIFSISGGLSRPRGTSSALGPRRFRFPFQPNSEPRGQAQRQRPPQRYRDHVSGCGNHCRAPLIVQSIEDVRVEQMAVLS